jgi:hypothetical protein
MHQRGEWLEDWGVVIVAKTTKKQFEYLLNTQRISQLAAWQ